MINHQDDRVLDTAHANYEIRIKTQPLKPMSMLRIAKED